MKKEKRQNLIIDIISRYDIDTQEELVLKLQNEGENITQATVSRDIKELNLIKVLSGGKYKYTYVDEHEPKVSAKMLNVFKESVLSIRNAQNFVVIKTLTGNANAAAALLDKLGIDDILGTIAGDDTIFVMLEDNNKAIEIRDKLYKIIE